MSVDLRKSSHVWFFAAFLPAASFGVGWAFVQLFPHWPFWVEGVSPLAAYGLLFAFFDKVAWHWPVFRWFKIVTCPDVRGRWLGEQTSSYRGKNDKNIVSRVIMEIDQTFSKLEVNTYYKRWSSEISMAQFVDIEGRLALIIMFDAEPKVSYENELGDRALKGVAKLIMNPDGSLEGTYFNAAGRHGELTYRRTQYELAHKFESLTSSRAAS